MCIIIIIDDDDDDDDDDDNNDNDNNHIYISKWQGHWKLHVRAVFFFFLY